MLRKLNIFQCIHSHCFLVNFSRFQKLFFFNEFDFGFRLFLDFVPFHTPYKAHVALQPKQQLSAVIAVGNKREVPKVFSVELKMVRRRKIFIHKFDLWRSNFGEVGWKGKL